MNPKAIGVTIGLPFYNAESYLLMTIQSVFAQTYQDWELLLIDDGSTDGSLEIAQSIKDPRVKVFSDGQNKKLAARLNEIVQLAKFDYIVRMDADDLMDISRVEKQMNFLKANPETDLVSTGCISITNDLKYLGSRGSNISEISYTDILFKKSGPLHASIVGKTAWFKRNRYNESLKIAQDYDLWIRASKNNDFNVQIIKDRLYYYREENNATAKKVLAAYRNEREMYRKYAGKYYVKLWLRSKSKSIIVKSMSLFNQEGILLKRRSNRTIDAEEKQNYLEQIKKIKQTKLPLTKRD